MNNGEMLRMVRRNKLVGMWAAEKLGLVDESAKAYSDDRYGHARSQTQQRG
jgi:hypothetical protein